MQRKEEEGEAGGGRGGEERRGINLFMLVSKGIYDVCEQWLKKVGRVRCF